MIKRLVITAMLLAASVCSADIAPSICWTTVCETAVDKSLSLRRGETINLDNTYINYGAPIDLSDANTVTFRYTASAPDTNTSHYVITGIVLNATSGTVRVRWTSAAAASADRYVWEMAVSAASSTIVRSFGNLTLLAGVGDASTAAVPDNVTALDWSLIENSNAGDAPFLSEFDESRYATGSPLYVVDLSPYATGSPLYVVDLTPYATGSPLYSVDLTPYATGSPLYVVDLTPYATGSPLYSVDLTPYATGSPLYVVDLTPYATGSPLYQVDLTPYATGSPLYVVDLTPYATGSPLYSVDLTPYATGSPLYSVDLTPYATGSPLYSVDLTPYATGSPLYEVDDSGFATGSPLYEVDLTPYATGTPIYVDADATDTLASVVSRGNIASNIHLDGRLTLITTNAQAADLVVNGSFTGSANYWTLGGAAYYGSGNVVVNDGLTGSLTPSSAVQVVAGRSYLVEYDNGLVSTGSVVVSLGGWTNTSTVMTGKVSFIAHCSTTGTLSIAITTTAGQTTIDNVSINAATSGVFAVGGNAYVGGMISGPTISDLQAQISSNTTRAVAASNAWATADGTTNYMPRNGGTMSGAMTISNIAPSLSIKGMAGDPVVISRDSTYGTLEVDQSINLQSNKHYMFRARKVGLGANTDTQLVVMVSGLAPSSYPAILDTRGGDGANITNINAAHVAGDGSSITNVDAATLGGLASFAYATGTPIYVETDSAFVNSSNVFTVAISSNEARANAISNAWATADGTSNYVPRTGGVMSGNLDLGANILTNVSKVVHTDSVLDLENGLITQGGKSIIYFLSDYRRLLGSWTVETNITAVSFIGAFVGDGTAITNINAGNVAGDGASITNVDAETLGGLASSSYSTGTPLYAESDTLATVVGRGSIASNVHFDGKLSIVTTNNQQLELIDNGDFSGSANYWALTGSAYYDANHIVVNDGLTGSLYPSNALDITPGRSYLVEYDNGLASTGSVIVTLGGWTNTSTVMTGTVSFLAHCSTTNSLLIDVTATTGQTTIDGVTVMQLYGGTLAVGGPAYVAGQLSGPTLTDLQTQISSNETRATAVSNAWATADGTSNYVPRTGGTMSGNLAVSNGAPSISIKGIAGDPVVVSRDSTYGTLEVDNSINIPSNKYYTFRARKVGLGANTDTQLVVMVSAMAPSNYPTVLDSRGGKITGALDAEGTLTNIPENGLKYAAGDTVASRLARTIWTNHLYIADTNTLGSELLPNPGFTSSATNWYLSGPYYNGNKLNVDNGNTDALATPSNVISITAGRTYLVQYNIANSTADVTIAFGGTTSRHSQAWGTMGYVAGTLNSSNILFYVTATNGQVYLDDVSVKEVADVDLSVSGTANFGGDVTFAEGIVLGGTRYTSFPAGGGGGGAATQIMGVAVADGTAANGEILQVVDDVWTNVESTNLVATCTITNPVDWTSMVTGTPVDIGGYAITDAYTKVESDSQFATGAPLYEVDLTPYSTGTPLYTGTGAGVASVTVSGPVINIYVPSSSATNATLVNSTAGELNIIGRTNVTTTLDGTNLYIDGSVGGASSLDDLSDASSDADTLVLGSGASGNQTDGVTIGPGSTLSSGDGVAVGADAVGNQYSVAVGSSAQAGGSSSGTAVGYQSYASTYSVANGRQSAATGSFAQASGWMATADDYGCSFGRQAKTEENGVAVGSLSVATIDSVAIGFGVTNQIQGSTLVKGDLYMEGTVLWFGDGSKLKSINNGSNLVHVTPDGLISNACY